MIDTHIPLDIRLFNNSDPVVAQSIAHIIENHQDHLGTEEIDCLRQTIVLIAAVREALANRAGKRTRSLELTDRGRVDFEANKHGNTINVLGKFKDGSSDATAAGQEIIIRRKDHSCEVLVVDPLPLG